MENTINIKNYKHLSDLSSYNHNLYEGEGRVIIEECDDDNGYMYYEKNIYGTIHLGNYIGVNGIFDDFKDNEEITHVTIDTELW